MGNNDEIFEDGKKGEEELLDFDFDDLSEEDLDEAGGDSSSDEEILELVDIIEPGEITEDSEPDELAGLFDDAEASEKDSSVAEVSDLFSDEFAQTVKAEKPDSLEADLDAALDGLESSEVDIFDEEESTDDSDIDDITQLLDDDEAFGEDAITEEDLALDSGELERALEEKPSEGLEADLDVALEGMGAEEPGTVEAEEAFEPDELEALLDDEAFGDEKTVDEVSEAPSDELDDALKTEVPEISEADLDSALEGLEEVDEEIAEADEMVEEPESDELSQFLEEEGSLEAPEVTEEELDLGPGELEEALEDELSEGLESDFDSSLEELEPSELGAVESEIEETEPEGLLDEAELEEAPVEPEAPLEIASELPQEDLSEDMAAREEGLESAETVAAPTVEGLFGISEEKVEAIVTNVIRDVVERVTRETMAGVAEKVIREAIDALKQSLESFNQD
jgi:pilus assembly protein FimV